MDTTKQEGVKFTKRKLVLWVAATVVGFAVTYTYGPLVRTFIEYGVFDFYRLGDLLNSLLHTLLYCLIFLGIPVLFQALILGSRLRGFRAWLPGSLIGAFLGYFLLIIVIVLYYEYFEFFYVFIGKSLRLWPFFPIFLLPDLTFVDAEIAVPAVFFAAGIYGFIRAAVFGLILGAAQYLFLRKTRLVRPSWTIWTGLLFGLTGILNSILFTYLASLFSSLYYPWGPRWDRSINHWMLLIGAIAGLIYGLGTGWVLRSNATNVE